MPRRDDIHTILIIGSGPIVIGQGCEFDYSGVQACRSLREEGYRVVLINSNPATIMTDPEFADATYIEPISPETVEKILIREAASGFPIDSLLPTLGGQTGLNTGMACFDQGILARHNVKMIGADRDAIHRGEDRQVFKDLMIKIGLKVPRSGVVHNMDDARKVLDDIGLPLIIRPAFTLGGSGGGIAYNVDEFETVVMRGLDASPVTEVLIEQSVIGWKEFEMEVMRDRNDNVVIICSIENIDPMGVHTGDSITVAPIQTLTDKEYQRMRDASIAVIRAVGVETGGSNIQFAIDPDHGEMVVVEMNPRVSRSSALASKATGYPIAKIAAKLAVGYTLDELPNPITSRLSNVDGGLSKNLAPQQSTIHNPQSKYDLFTSACFEPTIDYVVVKIPRWTFEKFPDADETLTTQMKSVGEAMSIGRTFKEALQKGIRSMEVKRFGFGLDSQDAWLTAQSKSGTGFQPAKHGQDAHAIAEWPIDEETLRRKLSVPSQGRLYYIRYALKMNWTIEQIHELTNIDPWFLAQMKELTDFEGTPEEAATHWSYRKDKPAVFEKVMQTAKQHGYSDVQLAQIWNRPESEVRDARKSAGVKPVYKLVDTCAAEFEAATPYYYSTYETPFTVDGKSQTEDEIRLTDKPKVIIIGGGPNRIGQGIEFDYCCVQAAFAMKELGYESVMINSNPETVSTDYNTSDLLFFEPLTHEDVLNVCERVNGSHFNDALIDSSKRGIPIESLTALPNGAINLVRSELSKRGIARAATALTTISHDTRRPVASRGLTVLHDEGAIDFWFADEQDARLLEVDESPSTLEHLESELSAEELNSIRALLGSPGLVKGVIVQFGGQTPLSLARGLMNAGVPILGTSVDSIDAAGDREQFRELLTKLNLKQPKNGIARSINEARDIAKQIGYPVLVRPSFVLGGRAMEIVSDEQQLNHYMAIAVRAEGDNPILVDKFLDHATEVDVDCLADYSDDRLAASLATRSSGRAVICGVMEHIEEAGIHSGDSACSLPPYSLSKEIIERLKDHTRKLAEALKVRGLMNVQYAVKDNEIYLIEVNPRASRTIPFVGKATGVPWAKLAAKVMAGMTLDELNVHDLPDPKHVSVKEVVFPFSKFPGVDIVLGPEMRSTGEVMGIDQTFEMAFAKAQLAAGTTLPRDGAVYLSVRDDDKPAAVTLAKSLVDLGFQLLTSGGTHAALKRAGIESKRIPKLAEGRPNLIDLMKNGEIGLIINTPTRKGPQTDEGKIRASAVMNRVPIVTTLTGANAMVRSIAALKENDWTVTPLQEYHV